MIRSKPMKRTRMRPVSEKQRSKQKAWVALAKVGGPCEAVCSMQCTGVSVHRHHILSRGRGGKDERSNMLLVCKFCHQVIHEEPYYAEACGFLKKGTK